MVDSKYLDDTDNDNETESDQDEKPITISRTTLILLVALGVTLIALSITTTLLVIGAMEPEPVVAAAPAALPETETASVAAEVDETLTETQTDSEIPGEGNEESVPPTAEESEPEPEAEVAAETGDVAPKVHDKPAIYYPINPPIIVNFDARGRQRFLQAELALMTRDNDVVSAIELHMPMIRNSLILLIGGHIYEELQTAEGKELLRQQCLQELQRLMQQEIGKSGIEQVLFTNFVMQ